MSWGGEKQRWDSTETPRRLSSLPLKAAVKNVWFSVCGWVPMSFRLQNQVVDWIGAMDQMFTPGLNCHLSHTNHVPMGAVVPGEVVQTHRAVAMCSPEFSLSSFEKKSIWSQRWFISWQKWKKIWLH